MALWSPGCPSLGRCDCSVLGHFRRFGNSSPLMAAPSCSNQKVGPGLENGGGCFCQSAPEGSLVPPSPGMLGGRRSRPPPGARLADSQGLEAVWWKCRPFHGQELLAPFIARPEKPSASGSPWSRASSLPSAPGGRPPGWGARNVRDGS